MKLPGPADREAGQQCGCSSDVNRPSPTCIKEISQMAELNIAERQAGDVTVLDMSGKITIGEGSVALRTAVRRLLEEGKKRILLNLGGVSYIDSSGIGE